MRLLVTGAEGALGTEVVAAGRRFGHEVVPQNHAECPIHVADAVTAAIKRTEPDAIVNCAGARPGASPTGMIQANALGPHVLASMGVRIVYMSTDCVFSGARPGKWCSRDIPDANDPYGQSKRLGEVDAPHVLNVRGSFLTARHGLLHWLLNSRGTINGWSNAHWNGGHVSAMAEALVRLAEDGRTGTLHVAASESITKEALLRRLVERLGLPLGVRPVAEPEVYRALIPDVELPSIEETIERAAQEAEQWLAVRV